VHLRLKKVLLTRAVLVHAVHDVSSSAHKIQTFRLRKMQNGGIFLWVLSTRIISPRGAQAPKHPLCRSLCDYNATCRTPVLYCDKS